MDYIIIVNDNGELKTISATEFDAAFPLQRQQMEAMLNSILDVRAIAAGEYDPSTNDDEIVVVG